MQRHDMLDRTATAGSAIRHGRAAGWLGRLRRHRVAALAVVAWVASECGPARAIDGWNADPQAAFEAARESGRPILALFTGSDWCPHCRLLEEHVLATAAFKDWADGRVELLVVDLPKQGIPADVREKRSALCRRYGVKSFPNVVLIAPDGARVASQPGYSRQAADTWIASVDRKLADWTAVASATPARPAATNAKDGVGDAVREAVREAEGSKRPILLVVSRASDQDGRIRAASLVNDPEFRSFTKDTFVVAEVAARDGDDDGEPAQPAAEPLHSLLGGVSLPSDEVELIVTYDGRTPMYTQSARQPVPRLISGLRRFLAARPTVRR